MFRMTDFKADCTINLHVENRGKTGKLAWACSVVHYKRGRVVNASKASGELSREGAEQEALLFGLQQTARLLQEKVDVAANFPLKGLLPEEGKPLREVAPAKRTKIDEIARAWTAFRLKRIVKMVPEEAELLRKEASAP